MAVFQGSLNGQGLRMALVVSRFNDLITSRLLSGAQDAFARHGVSAADVDIVWVPGAFELGVTAQRLARSKKYDAVCCLGAVIRGATSHFDYVAGQAASGIAHAALQADLPVLFAVLTCDTMEEALDRVGGKAGNKGYEYAVSAIEMAQLWRMLGDSSSFPLTLTKESK